MRPRAGPGRPAGRAAAAGPRGAHGGGDKVTGYELVADPARLAQLEVAVLGK